MAKATAPVVEDIDIDIEEIEFDSTVSVTEVDPVEAEIQASADKASGKKEKKAKKESTGEGLASTKALAEDEVGAAHIAALCGVDARELRMFLRKKYRNMETSKSQRYIWKKGDPQIQEIVDAFKAAKSAPKASKAKAETAATETVAPETEAAVEELGDDLDI